MELVKVDNLGLEENKAEKISALFKPMLDKMEELEKEFNEVIKLEPTKENCKLAKTLRLQYVKIRTGTVEIHKKAKADILLEGRVMDGWKNTCSLATGDKEAKLKDLENHFENLEKERILKLQETRAEMLAKFEVQVIPENLGEMQDEVWNNFIAGTELNYNNMKEAERKAEAERKEIERKAELEQHRRMKTSRLVDFIPEYDNIIFASYSEDEFNSLCVGAVSRRTKYQEEQEAIRLENEKLKKEAEEKEKARIAEAKAREAQALKERKAHEAILKAEREEKEALQRAEQERIEKAKIEEKSRIAEAKKAEKAPEKEKALMYINSLRQIVAPVIKDSQINTILVCVETMLENAIKDINNQ
jgi:hypothetical protein